MYNKVTLVGRLTRDPEHIVTDGGMKITKFTLAVDKLGKDKGADFINCVAFNKTAELINQYLIKGNQTLIEGRISTRDYTDKEGKKVYVTEVIADRVVFIHGRNETTENVDIDSLPKIEINDEDLPF